MVSYLSQKHKLATFLALWNRLQCRYLRNSTWFLFFVIELGRSLLIDFRIKLFTKFHHMNIYMYVCAWMYVRMDGCHVMKQSTRLLYIAGHNAKRVVLSFECRQPTSHARRTILWMNGWMNGWMGELIEWFVDWLIDWFYVRETVKFKQTLIGQIYRRKTGGGRRSKISWVKSYAPWNNNLNLISRWIDNYSFTNLIHSAAWLGPCWSAAF